MDQYDIKGLLIDIDPNCVKLSLENAVKNGISFERVEVCEGDMLDKLHLMGECQVVVSNPPYLPSGTESALERQVIKYESKRALFGGEDGLYFVNAILNKYKELQHSKGSLCPRVLMVEYGGE